MSGIYVAGFQLNAGTTPDPHIPTAGGPAIDQPVSLQAAGAGSIAAIDAALATVREQLSEVGSTMNRLNFAANNLSSRTTAYTTSESAIRDVDMARAVQENILHQIRTNVTNAVIAQASMIHRDSIMSILGARIY
mgnify:CR=1 FL=1